MWVGHWGGDPIWQYVTNSHKCKTSLAKTLWIIGENRNTLGNIEKTWKKLRIIVKHKNNLKKIYIKKLKKLARFLEKINIIEINIAC